ncbi:hypothetical protein [Persephonella sp.]
MKVESHEIELSSSYKTLNLNYEKVDFRFITQSNNSSQSGVFIDISIQTAKLSYSKVEIDEEIKNADELKEFIIRFLIEQLTGKKLKSISLEDIFTAEPPEVPDQIGMEMTYQQLNYELEMVNFSAVGYIKTADGKNIKFDISFSLRKEELEMSEFRLRAGNVAVVDPLIINLHGNIDKPLSDSRFKFDIDSDGEEENIPHLNKGFGFLVFDKNENKKIDDGTELFGTKSGNGFKDLRKFDIDKNNFIDEADPIFNKLGVWIKDENSDKILSLKDLNIGAIFIPNKRTPFTLTDYSGDILGLMRSSSIYFRESGQVGFISQIDLSV